MTLAYITMLLLMVPFYSYSTASINKNNRNHDYFAKLNGRTIYYSYVKSKNKSAPNVIFESGR